MREERAYPDTDRSPTIYAALNCASNQIERAEGFVGEIEDRLRGPVPHEATKTSEPAAAPYIGIRRHADSLEPQLQALNERLEAILKAL